MYENEVSSARKASLASPLIQLRNQLLLWYCLVLLLIHVPFMDAQTASAEHAHDTPHHDLRGMIHTLDDTVLSETFSRHATDVLHSLVLQWIMPSSIKTTSTVHMHMLVNQLTLGWKSSLTLTLRKPISDVRNEL